jgi:glutathione S-transferase
MAASLRAAARDGLVARAPLSRPLRAPRRAPRAPAAAAQGSGDGNASLSAFEAPTPKRFHVAEGALLPLATSAAGFLFRGTAGAVAAGYAIALADDEPGAYSVFRAGGKMVKETSAVASFPRPAQPLELYEFQGCPFCKRVRECLVTLDLDAVYYPCPRDGPNWRPKAVAQGGKKMFPWFRDPNTGVSLYESADIVAYLAKTYGDGTTPAGLDWPVAPALLGFALLPRLGRGSKYRRSRVTADIKPLTLWAYEASPFCVIVREALCELEIPHLLKTAARGSPKRQQLLEQTGTFQVPYLEECVPPMVLLAHRVA